MVPQSNELCPSSALQSFKKKGIAFFPLAHLKVCNFNLTTYKFVACY